MDKNAKKQQRNVKDQNVNAEADLDSEFDISDDEDGEN